MTDLPTAQTLKELGFKFEPQMGGNCTAWSRTDPNDEDAYVLITIDGGGLAPESLDDRVLVGWYEGDQELPVRHEVGILRDLIARGLLAYPAVSSPPAHSPSALVDINAHRRALGMSPLDPVAVGWTKQDVFDEADRIARLPNTSRGLV